MTLSTLSTLYELLWEASPEVSKVKELTQSQAEALLRTLETQPTPDQPGKVAKDPMFAAPAVGAPTCDDRTVALAGRLATWAAHQDAR